MTPPKGRSTRPSLHRRPKIEPLTKDRSWWLDDTTREEFTRKCLELGTKVSASDAMGRPTHWPEGW